MNKVQNNYFFNIYGSNYIFNINPLYPIALTLELVTTL